MNKVIDLAVNQNIGYEKVERLSFETFISRYIPLKKPGLIETTGSFTEDFVLSSGKVEDMKIFDPCCNTTLSSPVQLDVRQRSLGKPGVTGGNPVNIRNMANDKDS